MVQTIALLKTFYWLTSVYYQDRMSPWALLSDDCESDSVLCYTTLHVDLCAQSTVVYLCWVTDKDSSVPNITKDSVLH